jgi:hypothetical protein
MTLQINNSLTFIAAVVLKCERTVALGHADQRHTILTLSINRTSVNVGTSFADFHGASGIK